MQPNVDFKTGTPVRLVPGVQYASIKHSENSELARDPTVPANPQVSLKYCDISLGDSIDSQNRVC